MLGAMHPQLGRRHIVLFTTEDMISPAPSLSQNSSSCSPLKAEQALRTRRLADSAAHHVATFLQGKLPVVSAVVVPPSPCDESQVLKANTKGPHSSLGSFYVSGSQIKVDTSMSREVRQAQPLRHPPEKWTAEASQVICMHHEEARSPQKTHAGSDGRFHGAQAPDETAQEQDISHRGHRVIFDGEEKKVKGVLITKNTQTSPAAAAPAGLANTVLPNQANPSTCRSYSHGARHEGCTDRMQDFAASRTCKSNLLRSVSADVTSDSYAALVPSMAHCQEGQLGIAGTQKQGRRAYRVAPSNIFRSPSAAGSASPFAEKNCVSHRIVPFARGPKRKGDRQKKEEETKPKCEAQQKSTLDGLEKGHTEGARLQDDEPLPEQKRSSHCYHAGWLMQRGKSPAASTSTKLKQAATRLASHSPSFTGAPELPVCTDSASSKTLLVCRELESRPHIVVRSYKTFQQECARHRRPHASADATYAENPPESNGTVASQKGHYVGGGACPTHNFMNSSSECEASRGIQRQPPLANKHSQVYPSRPYASGGHDYSSTERRMPEKGQNSAEAEHLVQNGGAGTSGYVVGENLGGAAEDAENLEDHCHVLPHRLLLKRLLGSGAMGRVYLVELGERPYAVKIALQSDPAACMYLKQGWRNLVHLEKIHQRHQRQYAKRAKAPAAKGSCQMSTERRDVLSCTSADSTHQKVAQACYREKQGSRGTAAVESSSVPQQSSAEDGRKGKQSVDRDVLVRCPGKLREKSKTPEGKVKGEKIAATPLTEKLFRLQQGEQELVSLQKSRGHIKEGSSQECKQAAPDERLDGNLTSMMNKDNFVARCPAIHNDAPEVFHEMRFCRKYGLGNIKSIPLSGSEAPASGQHVRAEKRERYFCRPVAFLEGDWFSLEALQQEAPAGAAAAAKLKNLQLPRLQKTPVEQRLPPCELLTMQQVTAAAGPAACFASHSSGNSPPLRKHKHSWQAPGEHGAPPSTRVGAPVPVCAYIMEYIPDACQLTAVIWNLHRCLDPSHALRRDCRKSLVAQRLVEIGLRVAEAHKCIASEAGLYSFDFNPKNILVSVVSRGRKDGSPPAAAASSTRRTSRGRSSSASPPGTRGSIRTGTRASRRQKEETNAALLCRAAPAVQQQQRQHQRMRQQHKQLQMLQQHNQQQQMRQLQHIQHQQGHTNLSPADITRLVLCEPQVSFRVVAIDLDCSLQAPFSSSTAALSAGANAAAFSTSLTSRQGDEIAPLLDWNCGRRVVYSCPHVSSITAAYIIAVLAKNKGEGQFTRSGLSEAAAHAALCCRIDSETNFLHYLWAPPEKGSCGYSEGEQRETSLDAKEAVFDVSAMNNSFPQGSAATQVPGVVLGCTEHLPYKDEMQRSEDVSGGAELQDRCAAPPREHQLPGISGMFSSFCGSCIPAEASSPMYAPAQTRASPASTELRCSPLECVCLRACTSPNGHAVPLPAISSPGCSSPSVTTSHEEVSTVGSGSSACREEGRGTDLPPPIVHAEDHKGRSCGGQPACRMGGRLIHNPGTATSCNNRSSSEQDASLSAEAEDCGIATWQGARNRDKEHHTRNDVPGVRSCLRTLPFDNPAVAQAQEVAAETRTALIPQKPQLYLPCFLYPRWGPKTPRGICQKDYKRYGVRLMGQHVNLQLLAFILCELLDFRSLHVVVLQRFGLELRALHLPTGICQMFSEQDQIISCLCFSALTRMTSAVIPPVRLLSLASAKLSPSRLLRLFPAEPFCTLQPGCGLPTPVGDRTACGCQPVQKLRNDAEEGYCSSQENSNGSSKKQPDIFYAAANKGRHDVFSSREKYSTGGAAVCELTRKGAPPAYSAGDCPAVLLLQKPGTEEGLLLFPAAAANGCTCMLPQRNTEDVPNGSTAVTDGQVDIKARADSISSRSSTITRWSTRMQQHGQCEASEKTKRSSCNQEGSPSRELGKKGAGQEGNGKTHAVQMHRANQSIHHTICVQRSIKGRHSRHGLPSQSHHLPSFAGCCANAGTEDNSKLRLTPREAGGAATVPGTSGPPGAVAAAVAAPAGLRMKHTGQQRTQVEVHRGASKAGCIRQSCLPSLGTMQQQHEEWKKARERTQSQDEVHQLTDGLSFGVCVGNQRLDAIAHAFVAEMQDAPKTSEGTPKRMGKLPSCLFPFEILRHQQQLQQEHAQQEQQQKVRRLMPEEVSRMTVWDKVEQLPALNPYDFLPPLHLFGTSCMQETAALNAVLLQFLDPHPFFSLRYSSSASAFDSVINALRQLKRRLVSLREEAYR